MRLRNLLIIVLVLALPPAVLAQVVSRADLVGTWVRTEKCGRAQANQCELRLSLNADSTWTQVTTIDGKADTLVRGMEPVGPDKSGRWYLSGDSHWLGDRAATRQVKYAAIDPKGQVIRDSTVTATEPVWGAMKAVLDKGKLFLYGYEANDVGKRRPTCMDMYCFDRAKAP